MVRVLCAMSGGVDSSIAAFLLKEAGHEVIGVFLRLGSHAGVEGSSSRACCSVDDARDAALVASRLGIPFYSMNYRGEFSRIIDDFVEEYHRGRTPNPCVRCNQWLKFGSLGDKARTLGCDAIATGHYARIIEDRNGQRRLARARAKEKDQSYFLFLMPRARLEETLFPVGDLSKDEVRAVARQHDLPVADKEESQEICFVPSGDYREVLRAHSGDRMRPGKLVGVDGAQLGDHPGHQNFTIGQRRGLGVATGAPLYVVGIDAPTNTVIVGPREALERLDARVTAVHWTSIDPPRPGSRLRAHAQIRYRHLAQPASLEIESETAVRLRFDAPQHAVTPGQAAVFYKDDVVLGGGWIE